MSKVILYTRPGCAYCPMVRKYLTMKNIGYEERDATVDSEFYGEYAKAASLVGSFSVPLTMFGDVGMSGWNIGRMSELASDWMENNA